MYAFVKDKYVYRLKCIHCQVCMLIYLHCIRQEQSKTVSRYVTDFIRSLLTSYTRAMITSQSTLLPIRNQPSRLKWSYRAFFAVITGLCGLSAYLHLRSSVPAISTQILSPNPIIGIISYPTDDTISEYIASSYVKWIESAGGRCVRIPYNASMDDLTRLLHQINGLLIPGGATVPNDRAQYLFQLALDFNRNKSYFPVWGTCLGFEWLLQMRSEYLGILDTLDANNISSVLDFTADARLSRLFGFSPILMEYMASNPIADYFHHFGIRSEHFQATANLSSFYKALATSVDKQGVEYIAAIEAIDFPIYGVQFHPEKNPYELGQYPDGRLWKSIDHSFKAIMTSQALAHFFIEEARKNGHRFSSPQEEARALLYNHPTSNQSYPDFEEIYVFEKS